MLRPGVFLQDRYEIREQIGSGGMSIVYKAKCHKLNRLVAIKVLKDEFCSDATFVEKFKMEAQAAAGLSHPNIVNVFDVVDEGDIHFIVMELIEGITLKSYIAKKGKLGVRETAGIAIQVAQGITAAHDQNIIHRDIKPQNIMISKDGKVKVADFGIARAVSSQTINATAIGSVHYISPEQARGGYSDTRSDLYSLGITMYEMVTGRVPFEGDNTIAVALSHLEEPIEPPHIYNPDITKGLEAIILTCTKKKPSMRYPSASELIVDLNRVLNEPDSDFVSQEQEELSSTKIINSGELEQIAAGRKNQPDQIDLPLAGKKAKSQSTPKSKEDDVNPQIEKLWAVVGIVVAVIIVAVLIFTFSRLGGIFNLGSSGKSPGTESISGQSVLRDTEVYMPDVKDLPIDMAEAKLKENFISIKITGYEYSEDFEKNHIMSQAVSPGEVVSKWSTAEVVVSQGSNKIDLSEFIKEEQDAEQAKKLLEAQYFNVMIEEEFNESIAPGMVIRFSPEKALRESLVTLSVSKGPEIAMIPMPKLVGEQEDAAIGLLADAGLLPGGAKADFSDSVPNGIVLNQDIEPGAEIAIGATVNYIVSKGPVVETTTAGTTEVPAETSPQPIAAEQKGRYVAAINQTYDLSSLIGPGSGSTSVQIMIRLRQSFNGKDVVKTLMEPRHISGNNVLPIAFSQIEGVYGVETGVVELVDVATGAVLKSYHVSFIQVN